MPCQIDTSRMYAVDEIRGDSDRDTELLRELARVSRSFLQNHSWCTEIVNQLFAFGVSGVIAIFLFEILPASEDIDKCLWVISGDLPSAYLVTEGNPTALHALDSYIEEMSRWVDAVRSGMPVTDVFPVKAPPTLENASQLASRLAFLKDHVRPLMQ